LRTHTRAAHQLNTVAKFARIAHQCLLLLAESHRYPTRGLVGSLLGIAIGTTINCTGTNNFSLLGLAIMLAAECFETVRLVLTQFLLQNMKFGVVEGQSVVLIFASNKVLLSKWFSSLGLAFEFFFEVLV
jgi:hypothetical protein